jgi:multimeric flavodoxin WrbA
LDEAIQAAAEVNHVRIQTVKYSFRGKKFPPCIGCFKCLDNEHFGEWVIQDNFQELRDLWVSSDVIIYGTLALFKPIIVRGKYREYFV